jgi:plastocyanin
MKRLLIVALLVSGSAACSSTSMVQHDITLDEFSIVARSSTITGGATTIDVHNAGEFGHTVVIADRQGNVVRSTNIIGPGADEAVQIALAPGEYEITCRLVIETESGLIDHYERGMHTVVTVEG